MLLLGLLAAAPVSAQHASARAGRATSLELSPYAGFLLSGDFVAGPLGTGVGPAPAPIFGAQLTLPLGFGFALVGNGAYSQGKLEAGVPIVGGLELGRSSAWLYDGALELGWPRRSGARPFLQAGAGGVHRQLTIEGISTSATDLTLIVGAGLDLPLAQRAGLRFSVRDYIGKFDFEEAVLFEVAGDTMHNIALSAGLRLSF
jgi:hypothetical protein